MKAKLYSAFSILQSSFAILAAMLLCLTVLPVRAQDNNTTVSAADFQRLVYSAHLHTQLALKPELGACLQTLLEMQRRNPGADPMALADLSRQALQFYRANEPVYIRTNGYPDEILAAYLDALRHIPAHTNFVPANLTLLNYFLLDAADYNYFTNDTVLDLMNSANQRLSSSEENALKRQALVDNCVARAQGNAAFATAMDSLLFPETGVSLQNTPAEIIGNTNSPLHDDNTMTTLLALSQSSGNGSLTVSSNQLMNLFADEMQTVQDTINTNLAVLAQINQSQPDYLSYLTNQAAIDANVQLQAAVQQGQPARLASASAAVLVQSKLLPANEKSAQMESAISSWVELGGGIASLCFRQPSGVGLVVSGGLGVFNMFGGGQSPQDVQANQIQNIQTTINDLSANVNYRFDRVDQSLTTIFNTMNQQFSQIEFTLGAQGQQIALLNGNVYDIRNSLVTVQSSLDRIEAENFASFSAAQQDQIVGPIDNDLLYAVQYPSTRGPFPEVGFGGSGGGYEADEGLFYKYALNDANNAISSPSSSLDLSASSLQQQLAARPLDANLNYLQQFLTSTLAVNTVGTPGSPFYLSNPQEWFIAAYAYLQLAGDNPMYFRKDASRGRVSDIISRGQNIANFCSSLTLNPGTTNINSTLWNALENDYIANLTDFNSQVSATETAFANANHFNLGTWRQWDVTAPRVTATATAVLSAPGLASILSREATTRIAAGGDHSLALMEDGAVAGWGDNHYDLSTIPVGLTNAGAIAAGYYHNLALTADGAVVGWGDNTYGQISIPAGLTNGAAIATGNYYSLALTTDGMVVGWGYNYSGEATGVANTVSPYISSGTVIIAGQRLTNVVAISAGWDHSLALKADGTVVGWGDNSYGETTIPAGLTNVMAIAAGDEFSLALKTNGTVVGWGFNNFSQTTIPAGLTNVVAIAAGFHHSLALKADGTVVGWGDNTYGQISIPAGLSNAVAISAGHYHNLALKDDGTVIGWGDNTYGQINILPPGLTNAVAIAAGSIHSLALTADGAVVGWGDNTYGQITTPAGLTNGVAIAAGFHHSLALMADGTVIGWGYNYSGEATGVANYVSPYSSSGTVTIAGQLLTNVAAISAGSDHSLALKADGTVVGWGANYYGQITIPAGLSNVVAISAGHEFSLALKADGTAAGWGDNTYGQRTIPAGLANVVAIAAGYVCSLALKADGTVVGWGNNYYGEATGVANTVPPYISSGTVTIAGQPLTNVVAIATGHYYSLALKADGTVVGWGDNSYDKTTIPAGLTNVVAIAAGDNQSYFLAVTDAGGSAAHGGLSFVRAEIPNNVVSLFQSCNQSTMNELALAGSPLDNSAGKLSGSKALLSAVLELGMPYTLAHDDVLHGFLYGSESLADTGAATTFLQNQNAQLQASPNSAPQALEEVAALRYLRFQDRLNQDLTSLQATGQPEIPRLVGQTLRLLNLLSDSWTAPANSPPPVLEISSQTNTPSLLFYGEPYVNYTLQYQGSLGAPGWTTTTVTNLQDGQTIIPPSSGSPQRFYRLMLPMP